MHFILLNHRGRGGGRRKVAEGYIQVLKGDRMPCKEVFFFSQSDIR